MRQRQAAAGAARGAAAHAQRGAAPRPSSKPQAPSEIDELARFEHRLKREMAKPVNERDKAWRNADKGIDMPAI